MLHIRNKYLLKNILDYVERKQCLSLIKYNKALQKKLDISIKDYKEYNQIEIELKVGGDNIYGKFFNYEKINKSYFHIYLDNKKIRRNYLTSKDNLSKIKVIIDCEIKSFKSLFENCNCISSINFIKFNRKDIIDMSNMFKGCKNLIYINFANFKSEKVTNMEYMFCNCSSLKEINLTNFNTSNVINMRSMFSCCSSLKEINLSNFDTSQVTDMIFMFNNCSSLINLDISKFDIKDNINIDYMFSGCLDTLKKKIKSQNKKIKANAFEDDISEDFI